MTITAAELLTIANERTGRSEAQADVDKFIKSWVADLTNRGVFLEGEEDVATVDDQAGYLESAFGNIYKEMTITIIDSNSKENDPLDEISWKRYKERVAQAASKGKPSEFCRFNGYVYVWSAPNATDYPTLRISGPINHADSTTIVYPDRFRECGIQYTVFKTYEKYGYAETKGKAPFAMYEGEVEKLLSAQSKKRLSIQRYNDI